jgi:putative spermidine/putrescine transport system ATP-binding protein
MMAAPTPAAAAAEGTKDIHVRFHGVSKTYGDAVRAVDDLSMDILRGEFLTLLGPSGSGKTTALMMLAGFEKPTRGSIFVDGRRIDQVPANRRGIGLVFQNYALFPHMTVAENLAFPLQVRRMAAAAIAERVRGVLDMVQLPNVGSRRPDQLSGGQQQRIAVARALIFEPTLVLMDEPLGALDKQLREQMQFEIKDIHARLGVTFVYVTHDQTEALTMSDRIAVFNAGAVQQLSAPAELYERPRTSFVASFIGENNRVEGTVGASLGGDVVTVVLAQGVKLRASVPGGAIALGSPVTLSIRPERAAILNKGESMPEQAEAVVHELTYVGDHLRVLLRLPAMDRFVVKLPNSARQPPLAVGQSVRVGWRIEDCLALQ